MLRFLQYNPETGKYENTLPPEFLPQGAVELLRLSFHDASHWGIELEGSVIPRGKHSHVNFGEIEDSRFDVNWHGETLEEISDEEVTRICLQLSAAQFCDLEEQIYQINLGGSKIDNREILELVQEVFQQRPDDCICADSSFEVYGCMCRISRMPG